MGIVAISASPREKESQTMRLVKAVAQGAEAAGAKVEVVDLCTLKLEFCTACDVCRRTGSCRHHDDITPLVKKLLAADGIVLGSPNYFRSVTAQMKTLLDRLSTVIHTQGFAGKYAANVSTAGGPGCEEVTRYMDEALLNLGADVVGSVAVSMSSGPAALATAEQQANGLGRSLAEAIRTRRVYPENAERHKAVAARFRQLVDFNKARWPFEHEVWQKRSG